MNQIAIGQGTSWVILDGESIAAPIVSSLLNLTFSPEPFVKESVSIRYRATTPTTISTAMGSLEIIIQRAKDNALGYYPFPQYLRIQEFPGSPYFYSPISDMYLSTNQDGYITHRKGGSKVVTLHYTRPNHFDGPEVNMALSNVHGSYVTTGIRVDHVTDSSRDQTALIQPWPNMTDLPGPLRIEYTHNHASEIKDIFIGNYYHPTNAANTIFFGQAASMIGGTLVSDGSAIGGSYRNCSFAGLAWNDITLYPTSTGHTDLFDGRTYLPVVIFFAQHAYTDLYLRLDAMRTVDLVHQGLPIWSDPDYRFIIFEPIEIPTNKLLRETAPNYLEFRLRGYRHTAGTANLKVDQMMFLPVSPGAAFKGLFPVRQNNVFIDDNFREISSVLLAAGASEMVQHVRQGPPITLYPGQRNRFFFLMPASNNVLNRSAHGILKVLYRKRIRLL